MTLSEMASRLAAVWPYCLVRCGGPATGGTEYCWDAERRISYEGELRRTLAAVAAGETHAEITGGDASWYTTGARIAPPAEAVAVATELKALL